MAGGSERLLAPRAARSGARTGGDRERDPIPVAFAIVASPRAGTPAYGGRASSAHEFCELRGTLLASIFFRSTGTTPDARIRIQIAARAAARTNSMNCAARCWRRCSFEVPGATPGARIKIQMAGGG